MMHIANLIWLFGALCGVIAGYYIGRFVERKKK